FLERTRCTCGPPYASSGMTRYGAYPVVRPPRSKCPSLETFAKRLIRMNGPLHTAPWGQPPIAARQACGFFDLVGRNTARIELLEAAAQPGCRNENSDTAAQRLGRERTLR